MVKASFLNQNRPLITGMILKDNPDDIRFAVKNSIYDGADCLGIQLECLKKEFKSEENYKKIFATCGGHPIYITNYRLRENLDFTDEEIGEELLKALSCGSAARPRRVCICAILSLVRTGPGETHTQRTLYIAPYCAIDFVSPYIIPALDTE